MTIEELREKAIGNKEKAIEDARAKIKEFIAEIVKEGLKYKEENESSKPIEEIVAEIFIDNLNWYDDWNDYRDNGFGNIIKEYFDVVDRDLKEFAW